MEIDFVTTFLAISGGIYVVMEVLKKLTIKHEAKFKKLAPFLPSVIGAIAGFFAFYELGNVAVQISIGLLSGALSVNSYEMFKAMFKK